MFTYFRGSGAQLLELLNPDNRERGDLENDFVKCYMSKIYACNFYETEGERLGKFVVSRVGHPFDIHGLSLSVCVDIDRPSVIALCVQGRFID